MTTPTKNGKGKIPLTPDDDMFSLVEVNQAGSGNLAGRLAEAKRRKEAEDSSQTKSDYDPRLLKNKDVNVSILVEKMREYEEEKGAKISPKQHRRAALFCAAVAAIITDKEIIAQAAKEGKEPAITYASPSNIDEALAEFPDDALFVKDIMEYLSNDKKIKSFQEKLLPELIWQTVSTNNEPLLSLPISNEVAASREKNLKSAGSASATQVVPKSKNLTT